jgi:DNA-binding transcriptional ArsR family regulator
MQAALEALVEPTRREILRLVWHQELPATDIASHFPVTRPAISKHLTVLKRAGLISERRLGTQRLYRADPRAMAELRVMLETFWDESLEHVKSAAETASRRPLRERKA